MVKSIIKEIFIIILLVVVIGMVLAIVLYDYMVDKRTVPSKVSEYVLPQEMVEELEDTLKEQNSQNIVKTYRVDGKDLKVYETTEDYKKGKPNPFDMGSTSNGGTTSNRGNSSSSSNSQGSFLNTVGK